MRLRVFGFVLFLCMAATIVVSIIDICGLRGASTSLVGFYIVVTAVCAIIGALGLTLALGKKVRFSLRALMASFTLLAICLGLWANWDYIPGTIRLDERGVGHGTGTLRYFYDSGTPQVEDHYFNGLITRKVWYRRDGTVAVGSDFDKQRGGMFYALRDDGTIERKIHLKYSRVDGDYVADGPMVYYKPDGAIDHTVDYRDGHPVSPDAE